MIRGIKIVSIPVRDQSFSLKCYTEKAAAISLALFTPEGHENRIGGFQPVTFWCDDVFATAKAMRSRGVALEEEPKKEVWGMAKFKDPDGGVFVFLSRRRH